MFMRADGLERARGDGQGDVQTPPPCRGAADVVNTRRLIAQTNDGRFGVNRFRPGEPSLPQRVFFLRRRPLTPRVRTDKVNVSVIEASRFRWLNACWR